MIFFAQIFAIGFGYFAIRIVLRHFFIQSSIMTKIVSGFLVSQWFSFHFFANFIFIVVFNFVFIGGLLLAVFIFYKRRETLFHRGFPDFLTSIILQIKIGKSFRFSFQNALVGRSAYQKEILQKIYQNVAFTPQDSDNKMTTKSSFQDILFKEFCKIDRSQHKTIEKLENFRSRLITANNFRRRSGRIRENIYVQVSIMGFFYVSTFVYVIITMDFYRLKNVLILSTTLFLLGTFLAISLGRKIKWTA